MSDSDRPDRIENPIPANSPALERSTGIPQRTGSHEPRLERAPYATRPGPPFALRPPDAITIRENPPPIEARRAVSVPITQPNRPFDRANSYVEPEWARRIQPRVTTPGPKTIENPETTLHQPETEIQHLAARNRQLQRSHETLRTERDLFRTELELERADNETLRAQLLRNLPEPDVTALQERNQRLFHDVRLARAQRDRLRRETVLGQAERNRLRAERAQAQRARDRYGMERDHGQAEVLRLRARLLAVNDGALVGGALVPAPVVLAPAPVMPAPVVPVPAVLPVPVAPVPIVPAPVVLPLIAAGRGGSRKCEGSWKRKRRRDRSSAWRCCLEAWDQKRGSGHKGAAWEGLQSGQEL